MTDIDRLRNEFVDAEARRRNAAYAADSEQEYEEICGSANMAARELVEALNESNIDVTPNRPEIGRKFELRGRSEQWGNLWIAEERGVRPLPSGSLHNWATFDASVADGSSEWRYPQKDDAKQDPTEQPSVRQDEIEIAIDFGNDGVTYIHPLQGEWTPVYRFDEKGQIRDTIRVRVEGGAPERQYTEKQIRKALYLEGLFAREIDATIDLLRRNR